MIHVQGHSVPGGVQKMRAPLVVIFDDFGNPLAIAVEHQPRVVVFYTRADPEFPEMMRISGVPDPVIDAPQMKMPPPPANYRPYSLVQP